MANPDQKTILLDQSYKDIIKVCEKFQEDSGASNLEVKNLLIELSRQWGEDHDYNEFGFH